MIFRFILFIFLYHPIMAQEMVQNYLSKIPQKANLSDNIVPIGELFLNKPYQGGTLESAAPEHLILNFEAFDCVTFVETTLALAQTKQQNKTDETTFKSNLTQLRYQNGIIDGYVSRLHYFSEWILQQQKNGILIDITSKLGGKPYSKIINFMSKHRSLYPNLRTNNAAFQAVLDTEKKLNQQKTRYFIPKNQVTSIENKIQTGDIIAITSAKSGEDITHVGFATRQNGRIHLLHASLDYKKIMITTQPLMAYLARNKNQSGIMVLRLQKK